MSNVECRRINIIKNKTLITFLIVQRKTRKIQNEKNRKEWNKNSKAPIEGNDEKKGKDCVLVEEEEEEEEGEAEEENEEMVVVA